ncbi:hypothetical protein APR50_37700 [Variovorax paradoxus]|jgi:hypothetical protein|nr:hypothetical protein APR50_37700 [Variovorax paradoxus]KPU95623.1 hypothetical protein APR52_17100 [Variovorax paradoxus]KPU95946.1 hypothetical protein APR49_37025 [Variovorax paradoxus]KPV15072.1 hypothetical protein APR51_36205 [Variovorax paradoxus]KPV22608.1 hypothetical protein APR48_36675 [Variovorax paradoxus]
MGTRLLCSEQAFKMVGLDAHLTSPSLQLWEQMESLARETEWHLHLKLLAYLRGHGPAPEPGDFELVEDARVFASEYLQRWLQEQSI